MDDNPDTNITTCSTKEAAVFFLTLPEQLEVRKLAIYRSDKYIINVATTEGKSKDAAQLCDIVDSSNEVGWPSCNKYTKYLALWRENKEGNTTEICLSINKLHVFSSDKSKYDILIQVVIVFRI